MPKLQTINGCHTDAERVVASHGDYEYRRCPRTLLGAREADVVMRAREKYLKDIGPRESRKLPAKMFQAVEYVTNLLEEHANGN